MISEWSMKMAWGLINPSHTNQITHWMPSILSVLFSWNLSGDGSSAGCTTPTQRTFQPDIARYWIFIWAQRFKTSPFFFFFFCFPTDLCSLQTQGARADRRCRDWISKNVFRCSLIAHSGRLVLKNGIFLPINVCVDWYQHFLFKCLKETHGWPLLCAQPVLQGAIYISVHLLLSAFPYWHGGSVTVRGAVSCRTILKVKGSRWLTSLEKVPRVSFTANVQS